MEVRKLIVGLFALLVLGLAAPGIALADLTVNTFTDDTTSGNGLCSLREAILFENGTAEPDCSAIATAPTTTIDLPAGTYTLSNGELPMSSSSPVTIAGAGAGSTTIDANFKGRAFNISSGVVTISGLTIQDGRAGPALIGPPPGPGHDLPSGPEPDHFWRRCCGRRDPRAGHAHTP